MSEYIVKTDGEFGMYRSGLFVLEDEYMAVPAEPLIRCRDCKHFHASMTAHAWCARLLDIYGNSLTFNAKPEDYCAWAEPKVGVRK